MNMFVVWGLVIVVSIVVEAITIDLVSIWFSIGALAAAFAAWLKAPLFVQIIIFVIVSVIAIMITRPLAKKILQGNIIKTNYDRIIGKPALVLNRISPEQKGQVKVMGTTWSATSLNNVILEAGEYGEIVSIEGAHVVVKKI